MQKLDSTQLPDDVKAAIAAVEHVLADRFAGRRFIPDPVIGSIALEDGTILHFVMAPPGMTQRDTILRASLALDKARDRGADALLDALTKYRSIAIVECVHFVSGMPAPKDKEDPRAVARDYLLDLQGEPGALGDAFGTVANAVLEMCTPQGATLGKLQTPRTG